VTLLRFEAKREQGERFHGLLPESQGRNLAVAVLYVPCLLASGCATKAERREREMRERERSNRLRALRPTRSHTVDVSNE